MNVPISGSGSHPQLCVGLTGGIGSGKSTVSRMFEELGAAIIDTDSIAHQLTQADGQAIPSICNSFGKNYLTPAGALDRGKMRNLIFTEHEAKTRLENILHPMILPTCKAQLAKTTTAPYTLLSAPLLLECPTFLSLVQRVLLVDCTEQNQISRVIQRSGLDESQIRAIIAIQLSRAQRLAHADDIIDNNGAISNLTEQVKTLHLRYLNNLTAS